MAKLVKFTTKLGNAIQESHQGRISIKENTGTQLTEDVERIGFEANIMLEA